MNTKTTKNFWTELPKPFFALAPLANVTDAAFRRLIAKYGKFTRTDGSRGGPHVMYTEFVSADGLVLAGSDGKRKLMRDLVYTESERPIVAQFFTSRPDMMERAAALAAKLGFNGIDINMGCPDKSIEKQNAGAALIKNPKLAVEVIAAAKRGAGGLPVSVKTRLGYNKDILEDWLPALLEAKPATIALHARTRKEMSKVAAHWDRVARAVEIRDQLKSPTLIVGNGDVQDLADARKKADETGCDGVMLGRAIFGRPDLFADSTSLNTGVFKDVEMRLRVAVEHAKLFEELLGDIKSFSIMKKHFKAYVEGFDGAKELRMQLMETENAAQVEQIIEAFLADKGDAFF